MPQRSNCLRFDLLRDLLDLLGPSRSGYDIGPGIGQAKCQRASNSSRSADDYSYLSTQIEY
jgi:hypothetical protein